MKFIRSALVLSTLIVGCHEGGDDPVAVARTEKEEAIPPQDDRSQLLGRNFEQRFSKIVRAEGEFVGLPAEKVPYPDTYWPMIDDGINVEWVEKNGKRCPQVPTDSSKAITKHGKDVTPDDPFDRVHLCVDPAPSPLAKYMQALNPAQKAQAVAWEQSNHGVKRTTNASWFGHCPGWAAATHLIEPILGPTFARPNPQKTSFVACSKADANTNKDGCTRFEIGDVNALSAEVMEGAQSKFLGARCDKKFEDLERDQFGRIVDRGCKGVNLGASLIVMGTRFGGDSPQALNIDAQNQSTTAEIWNQPAFGYTVHSSTPLTSEQAIKAVAAGSPNAALRGAFFRNPNLNYRDINPAAQGFALVDVSVHWVKEIGPNLVPVSGLQGENTTRMVGIVELDKDPSDEEARIIGGELLDNPATGSNRVTNNPFMWTVTGPSADPNPAQGAGARRNPFVKAQSVLDLVAISKQQNGGGRDGRNRRREETRGGARGRADCPAVLNRVVDCLVNNSSRTNCVAALGGSGGFDAGIAILEECNFL